MEKSASLFNTAQNGTRSRILVLRGKNDLSEPIRFLADHYDVVGVNNFDEALAELRQHRFQLVISEVSDFLPLERAAVAEQAAVILETIGQGVGIMDLSGKLIWGNLLLHSLPDGVLDSLSEKCREVFSVEIASGTSQPGSRRFSLQSKQGQYYEVTASPVIDGDSHFKTLAIAIWDASASRQLQQKLNAIDKAGRELVRLETEIVEKLDIPHRLTLLEEKILRYTREVLGFDKFALRILDKKTNRLDVIISSGMSAQSKNIDIYASPEGNGISGYVASTARSYICHDVRKDRRYLAGIDNAASSLTVPIMLNDQVIGVFNYESEKIAAFNEDDRQIAEIFGRYVAIALHILDLMVVERHRTTGQLADNVAQEISGPLNDILTETTSLMEEYIGQDDMRHRLQSICDSVAKIRESIKQVGQCNTGLMGAKPADTMIDPVLSNKAVLVADDEPIIRQTIFDVLNKFGCSVDLAKDGEEAIAMITQHNYDLVLSDIKMPKKSGYDIFATAKSKNSNLPVVLMTGFGYDPNHSVIRARQEGLSGVLYKPFKVDELVSLLRDAVREATEK
jgi:CheY-like chemotaxis protein/GAF domain-containing protein